MRFTLRRVALVLCVIALNLSSRALSAQGALTEFREVHLGMEVRIVVAASDTVAISVRRREAAARDAFARIAALDAILSDWRKGSELRRLELAPKQQWVHVSVELTTVLAAALEMADATGGLFDPTVGPLTRLWREASRTGRPIDSAARVDALRRVDYRAVELDTEHRRVRLRRDSMALDLGAIAKGFVVDEALEVLRAADIPAALIEAGGDLAAYGIPAGTGGWRVAVPAAGGDTVLVLRDEAISTSGDAEQHVPVTDGITESHVLSARTGQAASTGLSVTVRGPRAMATDALATALTLVAERERDALAARFGLHIVSVLRQGAPGNSRR